MKMRQLNRRSFLHAAALVPIASSLSMRCTSSLVANDSTRTRMKKARALLTHRQRRIIVNNDGNDCYHAPPDEPRTIENFLSKRTSPLLGSQVDSIFYCTGVFNLYRHYGQETELLAPHLRAGDWAWELGAHGPDVLQIMVEFCHSHHLEVFWSMRMNDTHDFDRPDLMTQWKIDHPECLVGKKGDHFPFGAGRWSALDYSHPKVRTKVFHILQDVCSRYDIDGIELDFFRHPILFRPQMTGEPVTQWHGDLLTELLVKVRKMTEEISLTRNRPLLIAARVPDSIGYAKAIGLVLLAWMQKDLLDLVIGSGYFHLEPWQNFVALGKRFHLPVYACLSGSRLVDANRPEDPGNLELWRGEALNAWGAGVNGIYVFNRFNPRDTIFRELGDPAFLKTQKYIDSEIYVAKNKPEHWLKDGEQYVKKD